MTATPLDLTEALRWLASPTTRWLISTALDPNPHPVTGHPAVELDPGGNLPPLAELVLLAATRELAVAYVEAQAGQAIRHWWRIGRHRGFDTWTVDTEASSWRRWRIQPLESSIDVTPAPGEPVLVLNDELAEGAVDPLTAAAAGDVEAFHRAVLQRGLRRARAEGDQAHADALACELIGLDLGARP